MARADHQADDPTGAPPAVRAFPVSETTRVVQAAGVREFPLGEDEMMLFVEGRQVLHALNPTAWAVWDLCDGSRSVTDLAHELSAATGHPFDAVLADVRTTVERLGALALVDHAP